MFLTLKKLLFLTYALLTRAMTLGVRAVIIDGQGAVYLVRHTYTKGWHLPGGGVERNETLSQAVAKEVLEETNIRLNVAARYFHTYKNSLTSRFDHVALFVCDDWTSLGDKIPDHEIAESGFFQLDNLPDGTTAATRARLNEVHSDQPIRDFW